MFSVGKTGRKVQKIKDDIYNRIQFVGPARKKINHFYNRNVPTIPYAPQLVRFNFLPNIFITAVT